MILAQLFLFFLAFSFLGWVWETIYCTAMEKSFQNRGFLFGPICPIYGIGALVAQVLFLGVEGALGTHLSVWMVFLVSAVGSAIMEYVTSWYLEVRFNARWWDYSEMPLNLNGRICLPATLLFGVAGVIFVRYAVPGADAVLAGMSPVVIEGLAMLAAALLGADIALTEANLSGILGTIKGIEDEFTARGEAAYRLVTETPQQLATKAQERTRELQDGTRELQERTRELRDRVQAAAGALNGSQRRTLGRIASFATHRPERSHTAIGGQLKDAARELRSRAKSPRR